MGFSTLLFDLMSLLLRLQNDFYNSSYPFCCFIYRDIPIMFISLERLVAAISSVPSSRVRL